MAGIEIYESKLVKKLYLSTTLKNQDQNFSVILGTVLWGISFHAEVVWSRKFFVLLLDQGFD